MDDLKTSNGHLLNMEQASSYLNIKRSTVYQMVMRRELPVVKIGRLNRFRRQDLDRFINGNLQEAKND